MVSFIVPALPDEKHLYDCLDSIYDNIQEEKDGSEIILVLKCEKEREEEFREKLKKYRDVLSFYFDKGNRSEARNLGAGYAKSDILTFVDADTKICDGFISTTKRDFDKGYAYVNYTTRPLDEKDLKKRRLFYYSRFMNLMQWFFTKAYICRPYGFCMSVRKDISEAVAVDGEIFLKKLAGYGEDSELGGRYGTHCRRHGLKGKYEKGTKEKRMIVKTSFRSWKEEGFWRGGARMMVNVFLVPLLKRPLIGNWREKNKK
jgi:glycosyltransferase involved in cell wall biosynthesis